MGNFYVCLPIIERSWWQIGLRLVQTAAVMRASAENACIWRRRLRKIRKIPISWKKNYGASCVRKKNSQLAAAVWMSLYKRFGDFLFRQFWKMSLVDKNNCSLWLLLGNNYKTIWLLYISTSGHTALRWVISIY